jgi:hypothetical protein
MTNLFPVIHGHPENGVQVSYCKKRAEDEEQREIGRWNSGNKLETVHERAHQKQILINGGLKFRHNPGEEGRLRVTGGV